MLERTHCQKRSGCKRSAARSTVARLSMRSRLTQNTSRALLTLILWIAGLGGCTAVTFKPGASAEAMSADARVCRSTGINDAGYIDCMRSRGWLVGVPERASPETPAD